MPSQVCAVTGSSAASDRNTTFAASPRPNHTEISGIHANSEICLKVSKLGPIMRVASREKPSTLPSSRPPSVPITKPLASRASDAESAFSSAPPMICCHAVARTCAGLTSRPLLITCASETAHQIAIATRGKTVPRQSKRASSGRRGRAARRKAAGAAQSQDASAGFGDGLERLKRARVIVVSSRAAPRAHGCRWCVFVGNGEPGQS
ncbi:protein of unknown function [Paraburkholderia dioscoreae]|uniref:Uncharacterized protein n=1 Tax=Paraburkholderia dioscoreae TaxID=2604047 RepID=A0A5Q4ZDG1_9BURK|nr:protein of unknown function [Paraburkholderia dioscoreae]